MAAVENGFSSQLFPRRKKSPGIILGSRLDEKPFSFNGDQPASAPKRRIFLFIVFGSILLLLTSCRSPMQPEDKIKFDLDAFNEQGLKGPPAGLVSVAYEFCIPQEKEKMDQVKKIDPGVQFYERSPGRIGCTENQVLAVGHTHQPNFRERLLNLAALKYITEIREAYFE